MVVEAKGLQIQAQLRQVRGLVIPCLKKIFFESTKDLAQCKSPCFLLLGKKVLPKSKVIPLAAEKNLSRENECPRIRFLFIRKPVVYPMILSLNSEAH